ncbi:MAG: aldehyde dehydrogenase family protein [Methanoregula sp.]|nr:aldehyde dehydrogenase family protein [Methanoregula sp.]
MLMRIGGKDTGGVDGRWIDVKNPATGVLIDRVPSGTPDDVAHAVDAADAVSSIWKKKSMRERGIILFHAARLVREQHKDIAKILTMEQGKPLKEAIDEVRGFASILEFYAGISAHSTGEAIRLGPAGDCMVVHEPIGICGAIIPWNMPVLIMGWKIGPALLAGNTMVLKPASTTPLSSLKLAAILDKAGLPPGVLNVVTGSGESVGEAIVMHPLIKKISFTGDCTTGEKIRRLASGQLKDLTLELGGSDPMIVMDDADIDKAVEGALRGRFYNAGQTCTAVKRLYVHEKIADTFVKKLQVRVEDFKVGNGLEPGIDLGPMNSAIQRELISGMVNEITDKCEGNILTGGSSLTGPSYDAGYFYRPTLISDVSPGARLLTDEIFGPVLPVMSVPDLDTAIKEANRSRYGLGASVWTTSLATTKRVFDDVHAGIIWVNRHLTVPPEIPFGGMNESGIGRENGSHALENYSRTKTLFLGW